ncbi:kelch-like protein 35 [Xenopus laevis]|uniref:BTB domain-containing protein n=2 Tax=Xenopus laevis TaxID=8355 RepID=A0A974DKG0_XENLA|nr:kelch-like protein 35 [Xenopus laevis]OCT93337.1 hypothetical protein XELAEV_18016405mg [Xenopus laevis]
MHQPLKEVLVCGTNGLENSNQEPRAEKLPMRMCNETCHALNILQSLNIYRKTGVFTDIVLVVEGKDYPCHKAILSSCSSYFRAMFGGHLKESQLDMVEIQKIPSPVMDILLEYMYGGSLLIEEDNVVGILEASDLFHMKTLRDACVKFLENQLHPCNCVGIRKFADSFAISDLSEKSKKLILEGFAEVSCHEEFLDLSKEELVEYLSNEHLVVRKEEEVFEAIMKWVNKNSLVRSKHLKDLLELVKLPLLDPAYFLEKVEMDKTIQGCTECFPLLHEARLYYILGNQVNPLRLTPRRFTDLSEVIVIIGGCDKNGLLKLPLTDTYHPNGGRWKALASMPGYAKSEFAACMLKNNVYVSGGEINSSDVWMLNTQLNSWVRIASLNKGRWRHKMVTLKGEICAVGGFDGMQRLSSVECYNTFSNTWKVVPPMLEAVSSAAVVTCMNKIYVIGGAIESITNTNKVQCFDPEENKWTLMEVSPFCQRCINAVELEGTIYVVGGLLSSIFSFDPKKDHWREVASLPAPLESCGLTVCGGKIYILGGRDENGEGTNKVFTFDPKTGVVEMESPMQRCTSYHGCVTILQRS